jgi:hypothetical protein
MDHLSTVLAIMLTLLQIIELLDKRKTNTKR